MIRLLTVGPISAFWLSALAMVVSEMGAMKSPKVAPPSTAPASVGRCAFVRKGMLHAEINYFLFRDFPFFLPRFNKVKFIGDDDLLEFDLLYKAEVGGMPLIIIYNEEMEEIKIEPPDED